MTPFQEDKKSAGRPVLSAEGQKAMQAKTLEILNRLHIVLKNARIYHPNNLIFLKQLNFLLALINNVQAEQGEAYLKATKGTLFFNNVRLKFGYANYPIFKFIFSELERKEIGGLGFEPGLTEEELKQFAVLMAAGEGKARTAFEEFKQEVQNLGLQHLSLDKIPESELASGKDKWAAKIYFLSLHHLKFSYAQDKQEEQVRLGTTRRLMQSIFNHIVENESFIYGLTNIKNYDDYTLNHSVNVCLLSIALGRRLGLDRNELLDLGISAFFHDFGKLDTPQEILNKPAKLDEKEREIIEKHPCQGARKLVQLKELKNLPFQAINVALEHHVKEDLSGYPRYFKKQSTNLFSKIVKIADCFDAITTKRVYRKKVFTREEALNTMLEQGEAEFHPLLLRAFANMLGTHPVGTLIALDSGELGLVVETDHDPAHVLRPKVKLISDGSGNKVDGGTVDLTEKDPATGKYTRTILMSLDPDKYDISVPDYFLARAE